MKKVILITIGLFVINAINAQNKKEDFDKFFFKFSTDSIFQIERIVFPLEYITWKSEDLFAEESDTFWIKQNEWEHDFFFMNNSYRPQLYDNFQGELRDTEERLFQWIGIESGTNVKYFFKRIDGKWFLIKKENLGT
jgi:hypothetical protein